MKKKILAICDKDEIYLHRVSEYLTHYGVHAFTIMTFTNVASMENYMEEHRSAVEILLLAEALYEESILQKDITKIILLKEEGVVKQDQLVVINKYQSIVNLMQEVMEAYVQDDNCQGVIASGNAQTKLVGFYTPGGSDVTHMTALSFAQALAEYKKVLYLHLGVYPVLTEWFGVQEEEQYDLADLLYFLKQKEEKVLFKLEGMRKRIAGVDYVLPISYPEDLSQIQEKEWIRLLECICYGGEYQYIILDLGEGVQGLQTLLEHCDYLISPLQEGSFDHMRMALFAKMCRDKGMEDILEKITQVSIPKMAEPAAISANELVRSIVGQSIMQAVKQYV